jgi:hypothetical protein
VSLGDGSGRSAAMKIMDEEPHCWTVLERILANGGRFKTFETANGKTRMFFAPYTYFAELDDQVSPYKAAVVTGEHVNVRMTPSKNAKVITQLSHWVVAAKSPSGENAAWIKIRTPEGRSGYVNHDYVVWPTDFRAGFEKYKGRWRLRVFLAGD